MAIFWRGVGAKASGTTGVVSVGLPTAIMVGDFELLIATTIAGGTVSITANGGTAWTAVSGSPVDVTGGEKLYMWWRYHEYDDTAPSVQAGSDHVCAGIACWANVQWIAGGSPIDVYATGSEATSDTSFSFATGISSTEDKEWAIVVYTSGADSNTGQGGTPANTSLTGVTLRAEYNTNSGGGGGFVLADGVKASAGTLGTWTDTMVTATAKAYLCFSFKKTNYYARYSDYQISNVDVTQGDLILVGFGYSQTLQTLSCADNASGGSNTYNQCGSGLYIAGDYATSAHMWYALAKATETITISAGTGSLTDDGIHVHVISGMHQTLAEVLDAYVTKGETSKGTSHTSETLTTNYADDYLFGFWFTENDTANSMEESGTGFTKRSWGQHHWSATFDKTAGAAGNYSETISTGADAYTVSFLAGFRKPGGALLAAAVDLAITVAAALTTTITMEAAVTMSVSAEATLISSPALFEAAVSLTMTAAADLTTAITMASEVQLTAAAQAALTTAITMAAAVEMSMQASATLIDGGSTQALFEAAVTLAATVSADLTTQITMAAAVNMSAQASAALTTQITMAAAATCLIGASCDLTTYGAPTAQDSYINNIRRRRR